MTSPSVVRQTGSRMAVEAGNGSRLTGGQSSHQTPPDRTGMLPGVLSRISVTRFPGRICSPTPRSRRRTGENTPLMPQTPAWVSAGAAGIDRAGEAYFPQSRATTANLNAPFDKRVSGEPAQRNGERVLAHSAAASAPEVELPEIDTRIAGPPRTHSTSAVFSSFKLTTGASTASSGGFSSAGAPGSSLACSASAFSTWLLTCRATSAASCCSTLAID